MRKLIIAAMMLIALAVAVSPVLAEVGTIRIEPHGSYYPQPIMLSSPATFNISVQPAGDPTNDPNVLLVMSNDSYHGLTSNVLVDWTGGSITFEPSDFTSTDSGYVLPSGMFNGAKYQVPGLRDHLQVADTEPVWYAHGPFLAGPLTTANQTFTVALNSTSTRVLVYAIGRTGDSTVFNNRVPPTMAGFVVPDPGILMAALASFGAFVAFAAYRLRRRK